MPLTDVTSAPDDSYLDDVHRSQTLIDHIEHEMEILQGRLTHLRNRKHLLELHRDSTQAPIHKLPVEVLTTIMLLVILPSTSPTKHLHDATSSIDVQKGAWVLARVCSPWRNVALSCPLLWTRIIIKELYRSSPTCSFTIVPFFRESNPVQALAEVLRRSGDTADLSIVFETTDSQTSKCLLSLLMQESHRWRNASFHISPRLIDILNQAHSNVPRLQVLDFGLQPNAPIDSPLIAFSHAPALRDLRLGPNVPRLSPMSIDDVPINLPFSQITQLRTGRIRGDELTLLRLCSNLESFIGSGSNDLQNDEPFRLESLTKLDLPLICGDWLNSLVIPALRTLTFTIPTRSHQQPDLMLLKDLVARSGSTIEALELRNVGAPTGPPIQDYLAAWGPTLKELRLEFCKQRDESNPQWLGALDFLPSLQTLFVDICRGGMPLSHLLDAFERRGQSTKLRVVIRFHVADGEDEDMVSRLKRLRSLGYPLFYQLV